jgi:hypothetical protein
MTEIHKPLAEAVNSRMDELGLSPTDLVAATGLTYQGLLNIRRGEIRQYQKRTTIPLTKTLGWTPESIEKILAGGKPELVSSPEKDGDVLDRLEALKQEVAANHLLLTAYIDQTTRALVAVADRLEAIAHAPPQKSGG